MSIEDQLFTVLGALAGGQVYPDVAPPGTVAPYLVHQQVGGQALAYTEGSVPGQENCRIQVSTWSLRRTEATTLAKEAEALLLQAAGMQTEALGNRVHTFDEDTGLYGARQDFSVWVAR